MKACGHPGNVDGTGLCDYCYWLEAQAPFTAEELDDLDDLLGVYEACDSPPPTDGLAEVTDLRNRP